MKPKISPAEISDMLFPINNRIRNINRGGCGIAAVSLHNELVKHGYKPTIVSMNNYKTGLKEIEEYRKEFLPMIRRARKNGFSPARGAHNHYMVRIGNYLLDTRGSFQIQKKKNGLVFIEYAIHNRESFILGKISVEDLTYLNDVSWAWNSSFRRSSIPSVQRLIKTQLSKIFN